MNFLQTFIDDDGLKRADEISPALLKAIEESKISVIIFSEGYASSKWCLDELVKILECKEKNGQVVMPVFFHLNPSDVRKQTGSFKDALAKHEKNFKKMPEKIRRWRAALTKVSNLSGWDSMEIRLESKLVAEIVKEISKKLNDISPPSDCEGFDGIGSHIDRIESLLSIEKLDFKIVGICGNVFENLPTKKLSQLRWLWLRYCKKLQSIPEVPQALEHLDASNSRRL
ncbi:disease resistance-like protein DSC1 [Pistacia vera]|uniref:disease resistance-like protein DSC1 n=1 Tax=Pistacia vera TaxID=55513 RepID=UPI0012636CA7|nr:disease resistance-like protein DSC1 [Pistacia vera]